MRVLLNFLPLLGRGGGRQNALNLWDAVARSGGAGHRWLAVARPNLGLAAPAAGSGTELETLEVSRLVDRIRADNVDVPRLARRFAADVIFTPMGTGPLRSALPRVVGWHDGTAVYPDSPMWVGQPALALLAERLRAAYSGVALHSAERVCVQTRTMGRRVSAVFGVPPERIRIVPNGLSTFLAGEVPVPEETLPGSPVPDAGGGTRRILVVTTTMPAKNLVILPRVARALAELGVRGVELVVTLSPEDGAREMGVTRPAADGVVVPGPVPVRCVGSVLHGRLGDFYRAGAVVLVPSWVESFTAVYPEAWHFGLPVVTSDLDFARDLCGAGALYAPPDRPETFARRILSALDDVELRRSLREAGGARLASLPTWDQRLALYLSALEEARAIA